MKDLFPAPGGGASRPLVYRGVSSVSRFQKLCKLAQMFEILLKKQNYLNFS
jgi:hypothetical protein